MAPPTTLALHGAIALLMMVAIIELGFIVSMVDWLHNKSGAWTAWEVRNPGSSNFFLAGTPQHMMVDQGHTANGAAGTAFVLIGLGGLIALAMREARTGLSRAVYKGWLFFTVPALLLTLAALAYVFAVTNPRESQAIDPAVAATIDGRDALYPQDTWVPQAWFSAVLRLDLVDDAVRADVTSRLKVMRGWQYNLIPLFIVQLATTVLAFVDAKRWKSYEAVPQHGDMKA